MQNKTDLETEMVRTSDVRRIVVFGALGLACAGAHAQSSVTLYGIMDTGLMWQNRSTGGGSAISALDGGLSPSLWGMTGAEDIGRGYRIQFKLEGGLSTTNGAIGNSNGNLFGRNAYVGISGPFGQVNAGLQFSPFFLSVYESDPRGFSLFAASLAPYLEHFVISGIFDSNAVVYKSPTIAGFTGSAEYAFGNVAGSFPAGRHISASLNYEVGGFNATAAYFEAKDATSGLTTLRGINVGAGYKIGPVKLDLAFTKYRNPASSGPLADVNVYSGGAVWNVNDFVTVDAGVYASQDRNFSANKSMINGVGANYLVSKRTTLYAQVGVVNNKGEMATNLAANAPMALSSPEGTTTAVNIGIRHVF
jgi:predicted porin